MRAVSLLPDYAELTQLRVTSLIVMTALCSGRDDGFMARICGTEH